MKIRPLGLVLLLYVGVDFANPLMAGVIHFVDGSMKIVDAHRPGADSPVAESLPATAPRRLAAEELVGHLPLPIRFDAIQPQWLTPPRHPTSGSAKHAAPSDDH